MPCSVLQLLVLGKVVLSKLAWSVPIVHPNDVRKVNLYKSIAANNVIPVSFRMRQCETFSLPQATPTVWRLGVSFAPEIPRLVLVGLQTNKSGSQENNAAVFDHCNLTNMQVWLNHSKYPSVDMATDFAKEQYAGVSKSFYGFASSYHGIDNLLAGSAVSPAAFKSLYPIHVFDVSKKSERLTEGVVGLTVRMEFVSMYKIATVCPINKKGDKTHCENYRPISLLSNISKLFERVMYVRIEHFLKSSDILYKFGFRRQHSTNHALLSIVEKIRSSLDKKMYTCGVFIDLEKAFDTVNQKIILSKLNHYGIRGTANPWFPSYLSSRYQSVVLNGVM